MEEKKPKKPRGKARLIAGKCIACGARCESSCPSDAITMDAQGAPIIDIAKCISCKKCVKICPAAALEMFFTPEELQLLKEMGASPADQAATDEDPAKAALDALLAAYRGVWVFVEQTEGVAAHVSWELLGAGAELASKLKVELCAVVVGHKVEALCKEAISYGAQKVYLVDAPVFEHYRTDSYLEAVCQLTNKFKPEVILMGATGLGRDLAGAVATSLGAGLTADCTGLGINPSRNLMQTRPAFGGNIMATILSETTRPQISTVRPRVMKMPPHNPNATGAIIRENVAVDEAKLPSKVLEILRESSSSASADIAGAPILVSGGRGMMGKENFAMLEELANELGGMVGASRGAVDSGWMPQPRQVGQTGKTVRPKIYIACGISGAIQHLVGMQDSDTVIAINRDKDAPIFEVATIGIVGDVFKVVPAITKSIREMKASAAQK